MKIVHFLGNNKPWHHTTASSAAFSPALGNYLSLWWQTFNTQVRGSLEPGLVRHTSEKPFRHGCIWKTFQTCIWKTFQTCIWKTFQTWMCSTKSSCCIAKNSPYNLSRLSTAFWLSSDAWCCRQVAYSWRTIFSKRCGLAYQSESPLLACHFRLAFQFLD